MTLPVLLVFRKTKLKPRATLLTLWRTKLHCTPLGGHRRVNEAALNPLLSGRSWFAISLHSPSASDNNTVHRAVWPKRRALPKSRRPKYYQPKSQYHRVKVHRRLNHRAWDHCVNNQNLSVQAHRVRVNRGGVHRNLVYRARLR